MKNPIRIISSSLLLVLALAANNAQADNGFYIGGSVGNAAIDATPDTPTEESIDSDDTGYKVFGGFKFTIFAVEGGYVDFGKPTQNSNTVELSGFDLFGLVNFGIGPIDLFGKVGVFAWDSDALVADNKVNKDGTDPVYGVGAGVSLGSFSVRAEYEYFDIKDFDTVQMISLGAVYTF